MYETVVKHEHGIAEPDWLCDSHLFLRHKIEKGLKADFNPTPFRLFCCWIVSDNPIKAFKVFHLGFKLEGNFGNYNKVC